MRQFPNEKPSTMAADLSSIMDSGEQSDLTLISPAGSVALHQALLWARSTMHLKDPQPTAQKHTLWRADATATGVIECSSLSPSYSMLRDFAQLVYTGTVKDWNNIEVIGLAKEVGVPIQIGDGNCVWCLGGWWRFLTLFFLHKKCPNRCSRPNVACCSCVDDDKRPNERSADARCCGGSSALASRCRVVCRRRHRVLRRTGVSRPPMRVGGAIALLSRSVHFGDERCVSRCSILSRCTARRLSRVSLLPLRRFSGF